MTREELMARLATWIAEITEEPPPALTEQTALVDDLGLDSLALAELAAKLRQAYGIKLRPGELHGRLQVGPLTELVLSKVAAPKP